MQSPLIFGTKPIGASTRSRTTRGASSRTTSVENSQGSLFHREEHKCLGSKGEYAGKIVKVETSLGIKWLAYDSKDSRIGEPQDVEAIAANIVLNLHSRRKWLGTRSKSAYSPAPKRCGECGSVVPLYPHKSTCSIVAPSRGRAYEEAGPDVGDGDF